MKCKNIQLQLLQEDIISQQIQNHLNNCPECYQFAQISYELIHNESVQPSKELDAKVLNSIKKEMCNKKKKTINFLNKKNIITAIAAIICIIFSITISIKHANNKKQDKLIRDIAKIESKTISPEMIEKQISSLNFSDEFIGNNEYANIEPLLIELEINEYLEKQL